MTPRQHLWLLRGLRLMFFGLGVLLIVPYMDVQREVVGAKTASILLAGIGLMFVPYLIVSKFISARCPKCGGRAFTKTKWETPNQEPSEHSNLESKHSIGTARHVGSWKRFRRT